MSDHVTVISVPGDLIPKPLIFIRGVNCRELEFGLPLATWKVAARSLVAAATAGLERVWTRENVDPS